MNTYEAAQFINGLALKPGWTIRAQGGGYSTVHLAHRTDGQRNWLTGRAQPRLAASLAA